MPRVEIFDADNGILAFDLGDVLNALPSYAAAYHWNVLVLEAIGNGLRDASMLDTERIVESSPSGLPVTFQELQGFAKGLGQTLNTIIFGGDERCPPVSLPVNLPSVGKYVPLRRLILPCGP